MTYDFFASKPDKIHLLDFIFNETDVKIFDLASPPGREICEYKNTAELVAAFDFAQGDTFSLTFKLWTARFGGNIVFRKVDLNPTYCDGHTFRYAAEGWGLIQLYFGGQKENILYPCHIGHFNEKGALKWDDPNKTNDSVDKWNWKEIRQTSGKLQYQIHNKMAIRKIGSYGVLPGADSLYKEGIKLWGV